MPSISAPGERTTRWRSTGSASAFTSSGMTNARPAIAARARAAVASMLAMVAFNIVALSYQLDYGNAPEFVSVVLHPVELA